MKNITHVCFKAFFCACSRKYIVVQRQYITSWFISSSFGWVIIFRRFFEVFILPCIVRKNDLALSSWSLRISLNYLKFHNFLDKFIVHFPFNRYCEFQPRENTRLETSAAVSNNFWSTPMRRSATVLISMQLLWDRNWRCIMYRSPCIGGAFVSLMEAREVKLNFDRVKIHANNIYAGRALVGELLFQINTLETQSASLEVIKNRLFPVIANFAQNTKVKAFRLQMGEMGPLALEIACFMKLWDHRQLFQIFEWERFINEVNYS